MTTVNARITRSSRFRGKSSEEYTGKYQEKEESDLEADIIVSSSDEETDKTEEEAPIWLQDNVSKDADVALDSEDENGKDEELDALLDNSHLKNAKEEEGEGSNEDDSDNEADAATVSLKLKKLDEFVKQSQVYSSIIADTLLERTQQRVAEEEERIHNVMEESADEPPKKKQKRRNILDFFKGGKETDKKEEVNPDLNKINTEEERISQVQPNLLKNCTLKPYQLEGLNWLITLYENGLNGILADDMGLGKTIQSIALLAFIYEMDTKGPFLIAAPLSTVDNWISEFDRFAPDVPVLKYYHQGGPKERGKLMNKFFKKTNGTGVVITSYEIIIRDADQIMAKQWKFLIVDEGHRLKNINCKLIQELKRINTSNRLLLTGTPLQNNLSELWSLLNFILPDIFADFEIFNKWFDFKELNLQSDSSKLNKLINDELEKNLISNLHTILKPFLLRRLKKTVLADILPPKREYLINCTMTSSQKKLYKRALSGQLKVTIFKELVKQFFTLNTKHIGHVSNKSIRDFINYELSEEDDNENISEEPETLQKMQKIYEEYMHAELKNKKLQNMMMQLRQIVDSTFLFYFPYLNPEEMTLDVLLQTSGKLQTMQDLILPLVKKKHKVLVFSQFTNMLDLLEDWCELNSLESFRIDGTIDSESRKEQIEQFNKPGDKHNIFLLSTRAAGLGINLIAADTVVLFDSDWNPQVDLQAMDRCYRIGQIKPVVVYRLCCDNTVEHVILTRAANKRKLEKMVIQMGRFNTLKKLALNEGSFLGQQFGNSNKVSNKDLVQELSQLLGSGESSIGFSSSDNKTTENDGRLTKLEIKELTDRSNRVHKETDVVKFPHIRLFETTSGF
ncbi:hypothetical protein Kpol_1063p6 [Vanderwaltozyma polyspora DSM 70294]|uniref:Irc5p n=1 Tax=Vanderwaltozyma polyspora (strain ATCC 22028 / DSM 70294 / BCRC 21397 / CBS 2163 / NBRC 10782 / NRRL Y-8283 / UCD 57-17) TaxID=436907 RepID=A7TQQ1_VANPO|nr:uncharacterized protein Kpol_1063p6 [Vanderwaltozyma polyspora DSM 70294]EDO15396.1 hypothetical protein Kpol_1063p6 [Vanderwaltozyma polyspora DSM 70294]